ncbi:glycosyltransferase family 2 protein [Limnoglobus roseus]|uniref:GT2 family glycosyltransferase n=1 Tax=Limnoglobus roseus TaxID=2598579 RepID=A0A5C1A8F1_9BACT|nr:glycosyltransferase family 2 protein [Limnoglobus roseus]QEL15020.1 GT2 family glycosyltransferase [Limnoglobus roseus]
MTRPAPIPDLLSLVIPVYNEKDSLLTLLAEIDGAVRGAGLTNVEILFIDDGSRDGSWEMVQQLAAQDTRVHGVRFRRNFGKAAALNIGLRRAAGDVVMTLDADLQDDPKEIPRFMQAVKSGTDVVSGYKKVRHDPWHKVFPSRVFNWMVSKLTGVKLHDHNCGFKAYRGEVIREVRLYGDLHRYVPVLAHEAGFTVGELVINHRPRKFGHSKFGARRFLKGFLDLISVWFRTTFGYRPMHAFGTLAVLLGSVGIALHLLLTFVPVGNTISNLFGLLPVLCLVFAAQSVFTGLLAEYVLARSTPDDPYRVAEMTLDPTQRTK